MTKNSKHRARNGGLDKYYTKRYVADFLSFLVLDMFGKDNVFIEPTAGNGAFMNVIPNIKGYDISPERDDIQQQDVFTLSIPQNSIVIGNPPFGFMSVMAINIFNHLAAQKPKAICFILPKTFNKESVQRQLDPYYVLKTNINLPDNSFTTDGEDRSVPCVFQIWVYSRHKRKTNDRVSITSKWIEFVDREQADVAVRRVGGRAGQVLPGLNHSRTSTYFIKLKHPLAEKALRLIRRDLYINNTAGVRSISKNEIVGEVNRIMCVLTG